MTQPARQGPLIAHRLFYTGLALIYAVLIAGWLAGNISSLQPDAVGLVSVARLFGLLAGFSVLLQVFLMGRVPLVDQRFNLHEIVRLHRWNGYAVAGFLALHIITMTAGYAGLSDNTLWPQFLQLITRFRDVFKALLAAILVFTAVALSVGAARRRVPYEFWYFIHLTLYVAILLALFHQINTGGDVIRGDWFRYYWLGLYVFVFGIWCYYRVVRIGLLYLRYRFRISRIIREADGIYSVYVDGDNLQNFTFEPGQYAGWRILTWRTWWQNHPYSFSAAASTESTGHNGLRFTINQADGSFTHAIPGIKAGTKVLVDGPRGSFTARRAQTKRAVLIAGGIGVAPYLSLIPELLRRQFEVHLLYAARDRQHTAFGSELHVLEQKGLRLEYFYGTDHIRIDETVLGKYTNGTTTFFLCGPDPMVTGLTALLHRLNVPADLIVTERFNV